MTNSLPWKDPPFLIGKPSISMGHLYHGKLSVITRLDKSTGLSSCYIMFLSVLGGVMFNHFQTHWKKTCEGQARRSLQFVWIGLVIFWIFCVMALQVSIPSDPGADECRHGGRMELNAVFFVPFLFHGTCSCGWYRRSVFR